MKMKSDGLFLAIGSIIGVAVGVGFITFFPNGNKKEYLWRTSNGCIFAIVESEISNNIRFYFKPEKSSPSCPLLEAKKP